MQVSLIDGKVEITPKEDGRIDPMELLKATNDSGVSVAEMIAVIHGQVKQNTAGEFVLQSDESHSFNVNSEQLKDFINKEVTVRALLFKKDEHQKKLPATLTLTILEIVKE